MYKVNDEHLDTEETFDTYDEAMEYCFEQEIIYYSRAMNYLMENDCSLRESMGLCDDHGYDLESVSSELLATIHYQNELISSIEEVEEVEETETGGDL